MLKLLATADLCLKSIKKVSLIVLLTAFYSSCKTSAPNVSGAASAPTPETPEVPCLAPCPSSSSGLASASSDLKAFGDKKYFWKKRALTVCFLDGTPTLQERVMHNATEWSQYAKVTFRQIKEPGADIRVSFRGVGHWSQVGTAAENIPQSAATMNLQISDQTNDNEVSRVALHEFGHALGLMHEHRQPGNPIHWNKPVVQKWYMAPPNNWSVSQIEEQVFRPYNSPTTVSNGYHPDSIMHYPILPGWTTDGFTVGWNSKLAPSDKTFIAQCYP